MSQVKNNFLERIDAPRDCLLTANKSRKDRVIHTVEQRQLLTSQAPVAVQLYLNTSGSARLKRGHPTPKSYRIQSVPHELHAKDIGFDGSDVVYDLYCSFVHQGKNFNSGHWWACVKTSSGWFEVNDFNTSRIEGERDLMQRVAPCRCVNDECFALMTVDATSLFRSRFRREDEVSVSALLYTQRK